MGAKVKQVYAQTFADLNKFTQPSDADSKLLLKDEVNRLIQTCLSIPALITNGSGLRVSDTVEEIAEKIDTAYIEIIIHKLSKFDLLKAVFSLNELKLLGNIDPIDIEEIRVSINIISNFLRQIEDNLDSHKKTLGVENNSTAIQNIDVAFGEILSAVETLE